MLISQRLEKLAVEHDDSRRTIGLYLLDNPKSVDVLTMAQIAAETFSSKATLVRVAKQLGFDGWTAFARAYGREQDRAAERASAIDHNIPFAPGAPMRDIMASVAQVRADSCLETMQQQDARDMERAVSYLVDAGHIMLLGMSTNEQCLGLFQRKLLQIGINTSLPIVADYGAATQLLKAGDCVVASSYTGENEMRKPMVYLKKLRERGVRVIALTSEGDNYLRRNADVTLTVLSREKLYQKIATFSTEASTECLLDMLYAGVFARDYERNLRYKTETSREVEINRVVGNGLVAE